MSDRDEIEKRLKALAGARVALFKKLQQQQDGIRDRLSKFSVERRALEVEMAQFSQLVNEVVKVDCERRTLTTALHSLDEAA